MSELVSPIFAQDVNATQAVAGDPAASATSLVELLFFAYRDFVGEPDRLLARYSFGRAHHRVLHFVHRNPGLTIAELLEVLGITKQSLARVLKELMLAEFVEQKAGDQDRRQRRLFLTVKGRDLAAQLLGMQSRRIQRAISGLDSAQKRVIKAFLLDLVDADQRHAIALLSRFDHQGQEESGR